MFRNEYKASKDLLLEGYKLITKSFLIFGFFLVALAGLIFIFPTIIGTLFAIFTFLAGLCVLLAGYYFWQTKDDQNYNLNSHDAEFNVLKTNHSRLRHYHFKKFRFVRW